MNTTRGRRSLALALTALVAAGILAALGFANGRAEGSPGDVPQHEHATHATPPAARPPALTEKSVALREDMRKLWEDHIIWTRLAIISLVAGTPDTDATVARLLQNQTDIGDAVEPFYGKAAGDALTSLLRDHILIAADLVGAAKAGDDGAVADAQARWVANADEIAAFLHDANPRYWPLGVLKDEMHMHLKLTTDEALARLAGDWNADVAAYDAVHEHILHMSDLLSDGLVKQFPKRFR